MKRYITLLLLYLSYNLIAQSEPDWINNYPKDDQYFIGIGSSNRGTKSDDYERALNQARLNLAAEISTRINVETQIITKDSSRGDYSETFTEKLNQTVEQKLKELEIVDSYYSRAQGYWIYVRLNKNRWNQVQAEEMAALLLSVQNILDNDYFNSSATTSDKLFKLATLSERLMESPYGNILAGKISDVYTGNISDFVLSEIFKISSSISLELIKNEFSVESGENIDLRFSLKSPENYPGKLPFDIKRDEREIYSDFSDISGLGRINIFSSDLIRGYNNLNIGINPLKIGFPDGSVYIDRFVTDRKNFSVSVRLSSLFLSISSNREDFNVPVDLLRTLFTKGNESFEVTNEKNEASFEIILSLRYSDYPRVLENAPLMAGLDCIISLKQGKRLLIENKIETLKDGGLTYAQAYERVLRKLLNKLTDDRTFLMEIEKAILQ